MTKKMGGGNARNNFSRNTRIVRGKNIGKKNRLKKVRKEVLYIHTNIVTKKWGKKRAKQFFQKHTNSASKKCGKKIVSKSAKTRFLYSNEYRDQKIGGNIARNNVSRNTRIVRAKNVLKKIVTKKCENTFLIFTGIS